MHSGRGGEVKLFVWVHTGCPLAGTDVDGSEGRHCRQGASYMYNKKVCMGLPQTRDAATATTSRDVKTRGGEHSTGAAQSQPSAGCHRCAQHTRSASPRQSRKRLSGHASAGTPSRQASAKSLTSRQNDGRPAAGHAGNPGALSSSATTLFRLAAQPRRQESCACPTRQPPWPKPARACLRTVALSSAQAKPPWRVVMAIVRAHASQPIDNSMYANEKRTQAGSRLHTQVRGTHHRDAPSCQRKHTGYCKTLGGTTTPLWSSSTNAAAAPHVSTALGEPATALASWVQDNSSTDKEDRALSSEDVAPRRHHRQAYGTCGAHKSSASRPSRQAPPPPGLARALHRGSHSLSPQTPQPDRTSHAMKAKSRRQAACTAQWRGSQPSPATGRPHMASAPVPMPSCSTCAGGCDATPLAGGTGR